MTNRVVSVLKYVGSLGLAAVLLYFAFRNVEWQDFLEKAKTVDYTWVVISIVLSLVSYISRAYRWNILLHPMGHTGLSTYRTTLAILIGYLANLAFPRLGEITRCGILKRSDDVPVSSALGTVITERVIDLFTLLTLLLFTLIVEYDRLITFLRELFGFSEDGVIGTSVGEDFYWKLGIGLVILLVLVGVLIILAKRAGGKVKAFIRELYEGVISLRKIDNLPGFIISTVVLWVVYYFMSYLIIFSLPETAHLDWMVGVMLLVTGGIALAIPVQGGFGTYHTLISAMLALYAVEKTTGVFLATLLHTSQVVAIAAFGGVALLLSLFIKNPDKKDVEEVKKATAEG
ncbi:MAG: lysylphosphatidylglycerol synthase transmembrane domain-containing protein [Cyclobacteriaceae bacterium]